MASNSGRRSGSSGRSSSRKRVVIGAEETVRVKYKKNQPEVESERKRGRATARSSASANTSARPRTAAGRVAAEKRDERERRRRSTGQRRFLLGLAAAVGVAALVWLGVTLWNSPMFSASDVQVTGVSHLSTAQVLKLAEINPEDTLPNLPKHDIELKVETSPWVQGVQVTRRLPHTVSIAVTERVPTAFVDVGGNNLWLVSSDGYWIAPRTAEVTANLIPIRDASAQTPAAGQKVSSLEVNNAMAVLAGLSPQMRSKVRSISAPSVDKTALLLKGDVQVFIGSAEDIAKKDTIARTILAREKNVIYVNVRVVDRPTWRGLTPAN